MPKRTAFVLLLVAVLAFVVGCRREPTEPQVVGETTPSAETTAAPPTVLPLEQLAIALEPVAADFDQPLYLTGAGDGSGRLFVVEKTGRVWVLRDGQRGAEAFLDIANNVSEGSEQGLLSIAFPPDFEDSAVCYINYTDREGASVISRLRVEGDVADAGSEQMLLRVRQPYANHNGGLLAFGPDGYLYCGFGDGGSGGDPHGNGQNTGTMLGTLLRLDVSDTGADRYAIPEDNPLRGREGALPEIWAYGLRNPWRFSFDRLTGDLWIADVGQNAWEEVNFQPAASPGGENYGWNVYEGAHTYPGNEAVSAAEGFTMPVVEYGRDAGKSVTGGYVYRGAGQPNLWGTYLYADFVDGRIWGLQRAEDGSVTTKLLLDNEMMIASFGEDDDGELYVVDMNGGIHRVLAP